MERSAAGGEGGHGAAKPDPVITGTVLTVSPKILRACVRGMRIGSTSIKDAGMRKNEEAIPFGLDRMNACPAICEVHPTLML